jgi:hypothetical protein
VTVVILGVDPGLSCGLAELTDGELTFVSQETPEIMLNQLRDRIGHALLTYSPNLVITCVCERFVQRSGPGIHLTHQPKPLEVIGAVRDLCEGAGVPFVLQNPADAKSIAQNDRLRKIGLWVVPGDIGYPPDANDARDAIRHCVLRLATKHASVFSRLLREAGEPTS